MMPVASGNVGFLGLTSSHRGGVLQGARAAMDRFGWLAYCLNVLLASEYACPDLQI